MERADFVSSGGAAACDGFQRARSAKIQAKVQERGDSNVETLSRWARRGSAWPAAFFGWLV